jgi:hypothetical protein
MSRTSESSSASELDLQVIVPVGRVQFTSMDERNALPDHITLHAHADDDAGYHHPVPAEAISTTCKNTSVSCCTDIVAEPTSGRILDPGLHQQIRPQCR